MGFFANHKTKIVNRVVSLPVDSIRANPSQPRVHFAQQELQNLALSIQENGLLQPVTVRAVGEESYELIAGERRLMACRSLGWSEITAIVCDISSESSAMLALVENIQRQELDFFEEARACETLIRQWGMTQEGLAKRLGKAQSTIANKLRLLRLPEPVQALIMEFALSERHARALLQIPDEGLMLECAKVIVERNMTVAQAESYIEKRVNQEPEAQTTLFGGARVFVVKDYRLFVNSMSRAVEVMRSAGIHADSYQSETDGFVEFVVRVPKNEVQYQKKRPSPGNGQRIG